MNIVDTVNFDSRGLVPAIMQDYDSGAVLMLAYMNKESLKMTLEKGVTCFYSRSRQKLWIKGETSGNTQTVRKVYFDCDNDAILVKIKQKGVACHTGNRSCFFTEINTMAK